MNGFILYAKDRADHDYQPVATAIGGNLSGPQRLRGLADGYAFWRIDRVTISNPKTVDSGSTPAGGVVPVR